MKSRKKKHCYYCKRSLRAPTDKGRTAATRDHIKPKCEGGRRTVPCCRQCNQLKGNWPIETWREIMRQFPDWTKRFRSRGELIEARRIAVWNAHYERKALGLWPADVRVPPPIMRGLNYRSHA